MPDWEALLKFPLFKKASDNGIIMTSLLEIFHKLPHKSTAILLNFLASEYFMIQAHFHPMIN